MAARRYKPGDEVRAKDPAFPFVCGTVIERCTTTEVDVKLARGGIMSMRDVDLIPYRVEDNY